ncbi:Protein NPR-21 [Aphelenchoides avenae]|nr:Protein NPR-21 [Aphelenchus avenae]KAH7702454.1 Protein NPR-21 [Aphelenchus avenae]
MTAAESLVAPDEDEGIGFMHRTYVRAFFLTAYLLIFLCCVIGNSLILYVIIKNRSMRTVTNFFLANLATADLLVGIFCVFQNAVHFVIFEHGSWPFGKLLCHSYVYILHMIPNSSAGILVLLSIERFIAVLRPMLVHHLMTKSVLILSSILVWAFSALMNLPYLVAVRYMELQNTETGETYGICTRRHLFLGDVNMLQVVTALNLFVWYFAPLAILLVIYVTIGWVLFRTTGTNSVTRSSQNACTSLRDRRRQTGRRASGFERKLPNIEAVDSRRRVIRLVVVIVLCFALLSLPRYAYVTWSVWRDENAPRCLNCLTALIQPISFLLLFVNSGINPILYAFLSQRFRTAIADTFACFSRKKKEKRRRVKSLIALRQMYSVEQEELFPTAGYAGTAESGGSPVTVSTPIIRQEDAYF